MTSRELCGYTVTTTRKPNGIRINIKKPEAGFSYDITIPSELVDVAEEIIKTAIKEEKANG